MITYRLGNDLDLDQVFELYQASTLGERRPTDDRAILSDMIRHANLVVTAWEGNTMVGISRSLTDFTYVGYLADLAVRDTHQKLGIGRELIARTRADYYPKLGFTQHGSAWLLRAHEELR
jgi:predicted N-acetyltransferase YhbS